MKEIWIGKASSDAKMGQKQIMSDYLHEYFMVSITSLQQLIQWKV